MQGQSQRTLDIDGSVQYEADRYDVTNLDHVDMDLDDTTRRPQTFDPNGLGASREISSVNVSQSRNVVDRMESVEADVVNTSTEGNGRIASARQMHSTPKPESLSSFDRDMLEIDRRYAALSNPSSILKDQTRKKEFFDGGNTKRRIQFAPETEFGKSDTQHRDIVKPKVRQEQSSSFEMDKQSRKNVIQSTIPKERHMNESETVFSPNIHQDKKYETYRKIPAPTESEAKYQDNVKQNEQVSGIHGDVIQSESSVIPSAIPKGIYRNERDTVTRDTYDSRQDRGCEMYRKVPRETKRQMYQFEREKAGNQENILPSRISRSPSRLINPEHKR